MLLTLQSLFASLTGRSTPRRSTVKQRRGFKPSMDMLEDRLVPATLYVTNPVDTAAATPQQGDSLRYALSQAQNGDTIVIEPAAMQWVASKYGGGFIYTPQSIMLTEGELVVNKNLTIEVLHGPAATISGDWLSRAFEIAPGATLNLVNLNFVDCEGVADNVNGTQGLDGYGGAILNQGTLTLTNCSFSYNYATNGGAAIFTQLGSLTVAGCTLDDNFALTKTGAVGGAIQSLYSNIIVSGSTLDSNGAYKGGAIYAWGGSLTMSQSNLWNNSANSEGGALFCSGCTTKITDSAFLFNNSTGDGGAMYVIGGLNTIDGWVQIANCVVDCNSAGGNGGGIYSYDENVSISGSFVDANSATNGGGFYVDDNSMLTVDHCSLGANKASWDGAGIYNTYASTVIVEDNSTLHDNVAGDFGGAVWNGGSLAINQSYVLDNTALISPGVSNDTHATYSSWQSWFGGNMQTFAH